MNKIVITSINPGDPDVAFEEFVVLENNSPDRIYLDNYKIVWEEWPSKRQLYEYTFKKWKLHGRAFDYGEKIFLISGLETDTYFRTGKSSRCPRAHWRIFTDSRMHICSVPHIKVTLYDDKGEEIDYLFSQQYRNIKPSQPVIVIGHGRDPEWEKLLNHLHYQQGFEVEAFETAPHASQTIPDVIADLGDNVNMAILVMTGEDEMADGSLHPRLNVVQELGKFQERFGNNRTIILHEKGVTLPSNNSGIIYIPFEPGNIRATFGDILATIRREFNL